MKREVKPEDIVLDGKRIENNSIYQLRTEEYMKRRDGQMGNTWFKSSLVKWFINEHKKAYPDARIWVRVSDRLLSEAVTVKGTHVRTIGDQCEDNDLMDLPDF